MGEVANQGVQQPGFRLLGQPRNGASKRKQRNRKPTLPFDALPLWQRALLLSIEIICFLVAALIVVVAAIGYAASWFSGSGWWSSLLPFAASILSLLVVGAIGFRLWGTLRAWMLSKVTILPVTVAIFAVIAAYRFTLREEFANEVGNLRALVGGSQEAERNTLAHQVFAAYRRSDLGQLQRILDRAQVYETTIQEAAKVYEVDPEIMIGIGATESSFNPRDSKDGGRGLFQITVAPKAAVDLARKHLGVAELDPLNQRHNAFVAAATLRNYLGEMRGDLFLGLLAYNIGPKNGGLRSIMQQYGARDFVTIQPYLQNLPRDYPIRVLSAALAYRLWRLDGKLSRYEEGRNASRIQKVGIPGMQALPKEDSAVLRQSTDGEGKSGKRSL